MLYSLRHMGVESLGLFDGVLRYSHVTNSGIVHLFSYRCVCVCVYVCVCVCVCVCIHIYRKAQYRVLSRELAYYYVCQVCVYPCTHVCVCVCVWTKPQRNSKA
jgi:hypothetical protein